MKAKGRELAMAPQTNTEPEQQQKRGAGRRPKHVPHVPVRTCIICRERDAKRQLTRIVRQPDGDVVLDPTGKMNGRGAYICDSPVCWERAAQGQGLGKALKVEISPAAQERLRVAAMERGTTTSQK